MADPVSPDALRSSVRTRLAVGSLPRLTNGQVFAGDGNGGRRCVACGGMIRLGEPEYNLAQDAKLYMHVQCFSVWRDESRALGEHPTPGR
jgi:hypothetical protein